MPVDVTGFARRSLLAAAVVLWAATLHAQTSGQYEPQVGQQGKDVVWVPTPPSLVQKMLDMAAVTPNDYVVDLGSGDGRNVIAAAKRGARALGVEYNPDMVALSRQTAEKEGVGEKATFVQGDMFEANFSDATVLALFLLPSNMLALREKFFALKPGTRIVANTFGIEAWDPDDRQMLTDDCSAWCTALLWIVPAKVEGTWQTPQGEITFKQAYQMLSGSISSGGNTTPIAEGRLRGDQIKFTAGGSDYAGRVTGDAIEGTMTSNGATATWKATRVRR
jgi:ubiquinone/menaquinone biosynthesis C-methylase UbiE